MQDLQVELVVALQRDEAHRRPYRRFGDRLGIAVVGLLRINIGWTYSGDISQIVCPCSGKVRPRKCAPQLVTDALVMAIWRRGKPDALLHHSDQGSQYTREQFQRLMADNGVTRSMSRSGNVWDNDAMESFFSSLKTERTARKTYRARNQARQDVFDYIERVYNPTRRHSTLAYFSPMDFQKPANVA